MTSSSMPPKMKWALVFGGIIIGLIVLSVVIFKLKNKMSAWKSAQENKAEQSALEAQGIVLSYNPNEYVGLAGKLESAISGWGTDEDAVMEVFEKINNDLDYLELDSAFGNRDGANMNEWLRGDLSTYWLDRINTTMNANGVTKRV